MKPATRTVRELFELGVRYVVPLYQRPYVWDADKQWQPFWEDIEFLLEQRLSGGGDALSHFLGAIVLDQDTQVPGSLPVFTVIDGQQRLTTLQVVLAAACKVAAEFSEDREAAILRKLVENDALTAEGIAQLKVWPTNANRTAFRAVMQDGGPPKDRDDDPRNKIDEAFAFFCSAMRQWASEPGGDGGQAERVRTLRITLSDLLKVVSITLEPGDNAQIIFETLNARGTPLLALDLVKNAVFHAAERAGLNTDELYFDEWRPELDQPYWRQERRQGRLNRPRADLFLMHWLAMKLHEVVPAGELFACFRQRILSRPDAPTPDELIRELRRDAAIMRSFEQQPPGSVEAKFFERLELLDTSVILPVVLLLFRDQRVSPERRRRALQILESWLVRRSLMRLTVKNYNQQVPAMLSRIAADPERADEKLLEYLRSGEGDVSRWPTDGELKRYLQTRALYGNVATKKVVMALKAIEERRYNPKIDVRDIPNTLSVEHILPQSWEENWPLPEGEDPDALRTYREDHLHLLGNLTLTAHSLNSAMSNEAWTVKRGELNKFSKLLLNVELLEKYSDSFAELSIDERGEQLSNEICTIWTGPESLGSVHEPPSSSAHDDFSATPDADALADVSDEPPGSASGDGVTTPVDARALQLEFWRGFKQYLLERGSRLELPSPAPQSGRDLSPKIDGAWVTVRCSTSPPFLAVDLTFGKEARTRYETLATNFRSEIEGDLDGFGDQVEWKAVDGQSERHIKVARRAQVTDRANWKPEFEWLMLCADVLHRWGERSQEASTAAPSPEPSAASEASDDLRQAFDDAMVQIYIDAKRETGYNATRFLQMVSELGGLQVAHKLLASNDAQYGFAELWERGRLDLTVESLVLQTRWRLLFSDEELSNATARLRAHGVDL